MKTILSTLFIGCLAISSYAQAKGKVLLDCIVYSVEDSSYFEESLSTIANPSVTLSKDGNTYTLKIGGSVITSINNDNITIEGDQEEATDKSEAKLWSRVNFEIDSQLFTLDASATIRERKAQLRTYDESDTASKPVVANLVCRGVHLAL